MGKADNIAPGQLLKMAMTKCLRENFGHCIPPAPYMSSFGVRHLDALLGGGFTSSAPIAFSSTPESGKSTTALQYSGMFLSAYQNGVSVYLDTESSAGGVVDANSKGVVPPPPEIVDRMNIFGIPEDRFIYIPVVMNIKEIFDLIVSFVEMKKTIENAKGVEVPVLFVLDSIASLISSRDAEAEDANSVIGFKARELSFTLGKLRQHIAMNRLNFIIIDQIRSNMQIKTGQNRYSVDEKTVGVWNNVKSATNVAALQHNVRQWLFLSKGTVLKPGDPMGVDGWFLNAHIEKNKLAPSGYSVSLVFDKKFGIVPIWSEYVFLRDMTKTEKKYWDKPTKLLYPLSIKVKANSKYLEVANPETGEILYTSDTFMERNFINKYNGDENLRHWFGVALDYSIEYRIKQALFRQQPDPITMEEVVSESVEEYTNSGGVLDPASSYVENETPPVQISTPEQMQMYSGGVDQFQNIAQQPGFNQQEDSGQTQQTSFFNTSNGVGRDEFGGDV